MNKYMIKTYRNNGRTHSCVVYGETKADAKRYFETMLPFLCVKSIKKFDGPDDAGTINKLISSGDIQFISEDIKEVKS